MSLLLLAFALQVSGASTPAPRGQASDRSRPQSAWPLPDNFVRETVSIEPVADCLWKQAQRDTDKFLATPLMSSEEHERGRVLLANHASCFGRTFQFATPVSVLRGALAQRRLLSTAGVLDDFARRTPRAMGRAPAVDGRPFLVAYGTCLVVAQPGWTAALLRVPRSAPAEQRLFMQFGQSLTACMPEDRTFHVDVPALRDEMAAVVDLLVTRGNGA